MEVLGFGIAVVKLNMVCLIPMSILAFKLARKLSYYEEHLVSRTFSEEWEGEYVSVSS